MILKVDCDDEGIEKASQIIEKGGIVIFPTDTVYGMGCNPYNTNAVKKIYEVKSREKIKSLPVLAYSLDIIKKITCIEPFTEKIIEKHWDKFLSICTVEHYPFEEPLHEIYKNELCISPIPSIAIHCTNINSIFGLSPNKDWKKIWDENKV